MIRIVKNGKYLEVSEAAFKNSFSRHGWEIADKKKKSKVEETKTETVKDEWDEVDNEEKTIDDMTMEELQEKANELGINVDKLQTIGALKKAVKRALSE